MPIIIKDYTWTQTDSKIHIRIPLRQVKHEKVDLFTTDCYIKAHFSPFLFEVFLLHDVENKKSKCIIKEDLITFDLTKKVENIEWDDLQKELTKDEKKQLRDNIFLKCHEEAKQMSEEKCIRKSQMDRFTVQQAMSIDSKQHDIMDSRRDLERKKVMNELEEWRQQTQLSNDKPKIIELNDDKAVVPYRQHAKENSKREDSTTTSVTLKEVPKKERKIPITSEFVENKKKEAVVRVLPRLRESGQLEIRHTQRTFPTPSRESTADEEQAWLKNITMARRATGFVSEDLRPEEQDPQWCKEKGDEFFKSGNFLGAISAYSHGITLSDKLPSLFANRSATHFALGNFNKCVNDCSTALDLMKPPCESNRRSRAKCIARRAASLARLGYLNKAIDEMKAAAKLLPEDESIKKDVYDMERAWEQNPDSD